MDGIPHLRQDPDSTRNLEMKMKKKIANFALSLFLSTSFIPYAYADATWLGTFSHVSTNRKDVTVEFCKERTPDTFVTTSANTMNVTANNGINIKDMGYRTRAMGGIYFFDGTAIFSGTLNGKEWKEKAYYFGQSLQRENNEQRGIWFTKDCKGYYKIELSSQPASQ